MIELIIGTIIDVKKAFSVPILIFRSNKSIDNPLREQVIV